LWGLHLGRCWLSSALGGITTNLLLLLLLLAVWLLLLLAALAAPLWCSSRGLAI
jgi:hypothetical protein